MSYINHGNNIKMYIQEDGQDIYLLNSNLNPQHLGWLSTEGSDTLIYNKINASFFIMTNGQILGRMQGIDSALNVVNGRPNQSKARYDLVILEDNSYRLGLFNSWDYVDNIKMGVSVGSCYILNGEDTNLISTELNANKITIVNEYSFFGRLKNGKYFTMVTKLNSPSSIRQWLKSKYEVDLLVLLDGGGSTHMISHDNGTHRNDFGGEDRKIPNAIVFLVDNRNDIPIEPPVNNCDELIEGVKEQVEKMQTSINKINELLKGL